MLLKLVMIFAETAPTEAFDSASLLALAWDRIVQVAKLVKSELKLYKEWKLDSAAIGVAWLDENVNCISCSSHIFTS